MALLKGPSNPLGSRSECQTLLEQSPGARNKEIGCGIHCPQTDVDKAVSVTGPASMAQRVVLKKMEQNIFAKSCLALSYLNVDSLHRVENLAFIEGRKHHKILTKLRMAHSLS